MSELKNKISAILIIFLIAILIFNINTFNGIHAIEKDVDITIKKTLSENKKIVTLDVLAVPIDNSIEVQSLQIKGTEKIIVGNNASFIVDKNNDYTIMATYIKKGENKILTQEEVINVNEIENNENLVIDNNKVEISKEVINNMPTSTSLNMLEEEATLMNDTRASNDIIEIPDSTLKKYLNKQINSSRPVDNDITETELLSITSLVKYGTDEDVSNLEGLQYAINLTRLQLNAKGLTDLTPLSKLPKLTSIVLVDSSISDISVMERNENITNFQLTPKNASANFGISPQPEVNNQTVAQIADKFPNLVTLNLSGYLNGDINVASQFPTLAGKITDISPLSKLSKLVNVNLEYNSIVDFSPLLDTANMGLSYQQVFFLDTAYMDTLEDGSKTYYMMAPDIIDKSGNYVKGKVISFNGAKPNNQYSLKGISSGPENNTVIVFQILNTISTPPEITANDTVINMGETFNPLVGVTAYDKQDGEILLNDTNVIVNKVNSKKPGIYPVEYSVSDSAGEVTNKTIYVEVLPIFYDIKIDSSVQNGIVTLSKDRAIPGEVINIDYQANEGYQLKVNSLKAKTETGIELILNNRLRLIEGGYFFEMPWENVNIYIEFELIKNEQINIYTITASAGIGGSINYSGINEIKEGESKTFKITPLDGYEIKDVVIDGESRGIMNEYTFSNVTHNHVIYVEFKKIESNDNTNNDHTVDKPAERPSNNEDISENDNNQKENESIVQTGDSININIYILLFVLAGISIVYTLKNKGIKVK